MYTYSGAVRSSFGASPSLEIEGDREYHLRWFLRGLHSKSNCFETSNQRVNLGPHKDSMNTYAHVSIGMYYVNMYSICI